MRASIKCMYIVYSLLQYNYITNVNYIIYVLKVGVYVGDQIVYRMFYL